LSCLLFQAAQTVVAQSASREDSPEYRKLIRKALEEYELGNWPEAKLFFGDAHKLFPSARTLRGLGLVAYEQRDYVSASDLLEQSLASSVRALTKELRVPVQQTLEQSRHFEARLEVSVEPRGAELRIDDEPVVRDATGRLRVNPGAHDLVASLAGYRNETRHVSLDAGAEKHLVIELRAVPVAVNGTVPVPPPQPAVEPLIIPAPARAVASESSSGPWILIAASGAVAIGGAVLLGIGLSDVHKVEGSKAMTPWSSVESSYERSPALSGIGIAMLAVGGAGLVLGLTWQLWPEGNPSAHQDVALQVSPQGVRFRLAL
jgi:hypothetical protein